MIAALAAEGMSCCASFVTGHDLSHATKANQVIRALAPEVGRDMVTLQLSADFISKGSLK
jgi:hypothetical protein